MQFINYYFKLLYVGPLSRIGSVGLPYFGVNNKILNPDPDGIGEICCKSRNVFMGYHNDEVRTKEAIDKDGWYKSGDLGRMDQDGFLWISGRIKELLITSGGENIPPVPIENQINYSTYSVAVVKKFNILLKNIFNIK